MKPNVKAVGLRHLAIFGACSIISFLVTVAIDPLAGWPTPAETLMLVVVAVSHACALLLAFLLTRFTWKTVSAIVLICLTPTLFIAAHVARERNNPEELLGSVQVGPQTVQFYVDFGHDSAVLGFSMKDETGRSRYCPFYGSVYRGIPAMTLDVFVLDSGEMWVRSPASGLDMAYYRVGSDRYMTQYGRHAPIDTPMPEGLGGGHREFPEMDPDRVRKALTITCPE